MGLADNAYVAINYQGLATMFDSSLYRDGARRRLREYMALANKHGVEYWHSKFIPLRFEPTNQKYVVQQRKQPYKNIKIALAQGATVYVKGQRLSRTEAHVIKGGTVDIVRSGDTEKRAERGSAVIYTATRAQMNLPVPRYARINRTDGKPNLRREISRLTPDELEELRRFMANDFLKLLKADTSQMTSLHIY